MTEIAKSDVFFLITSLAVIVLTVIISVLLVYVFIIMRNVRGVVEKVKEESDLLLDDVRELRVRLKTEEGAVRRASALLAFLRGLFFAKRGGRKKREREEE